MKECLQKKPLEQEPQKALVFEGEEVETVCKNAFVIQSKGAYRFTSDATLLADFCAPKRQERLVEIGSGSGVISIILAKKRHLEYVAAIEIQPELANMSRRSVELSGLCGTVEVFNMRLQNAPEVLKCGTFDVAVCNPPYQKLTSGQMPEDAALAACKFETETDFDQIAACASRLLKFGGAFYLIHKAERLCEVISTLQKHRLTVKALQAVLPKKDAVPNLFLIKAVLGGADGVKILAPLKRYLIRKNAAKWQKTFKSAGEREQK